jgi:acyl-CoA synthetase (AMP-forming)/AMP-acid ligase II
MSTQFDVTSGTIQARDGDNWSGTVRDAVNAAVAESCAAVNWWVRLTPGEPGPRVVVYVVPARPVSAEHLEEVIVARVPALEHSVTVVRLSALPTTASGDVATDGFDGVPVLDSGVRRRAEHLLYDGGVRRARVSVGDAPLPVPNGLLPEPIRMSPASTGGRSGETSLALVHGPELTSLDDARPTVLAQVLQRAATGEHGIRILTTAEDGTYTPYAEMLERASRVAGGLQASGISPGRPVLLQCGDNERFLVAFWGCQLAGVVPVACTPASASFADAVNERLDGVWRSLDHPPVVTDDADRLPATVRAGALVLDPRDLEGGFAIDPVEVQSTATALMLLTSGSTGIPKLVTQTHESVLAAVAAMQEENDLTDREVSLNWFPLDHVVGLLMCNVRDTWLCCEQLHVPTPVVLSDPLTWLDLLSEYAVTTTWAPNFAYSLITSQAGEFVDRQWDLSPLRTIINGGEMVVVEQVGRFLDLLAPYGLRGDAMQPMWGMSETCSGVTYSHTFGRLPTGAAAPDIGPAALGRPIAGLSLRVVDDRGMIVSERQEGHLEVKGAVVTCGYFNNEKANAEAFTEDGWFRTGDRAYLDDGALTLVGRTKDEILVNGVNIPASEVETVAQRVEGVCKSFTAAVANRAADAATDGLVIFFSALDTHDAGAVSRDVHRAVREHFGLAPKRVIAVEPREIPKTAIGKIQRSQLAERLRAGDFEDDSADTGRLASSGVWLSRPVWRASPAAPTGDTGRRWFHVVGLDGARLDELSALVRGHGHALSTASWSDRSQPDTEVTDVVLALPERAGSETAADLVREQAKCLAVITSVVGSLEALRGDDPISIRLTVVTFATQAVREGEQSDPVHAAIRGFLPNLAAENPWLRVRSLDAEPGLEKDGFAELVHEATEQQVAYRDGRRWVLRFDGVAASSAAAVGSPLAYGGRYVVVGGLGGVGVELCQYLLNHWAARVLVVGRRSEGEVGGVIDSLARMGDFRYSQVNFQEEGTLEDVVAECERAWGAPLSGAFHLAGELDGRPLRNLVEVDVHRLLWAKVGPAHALADVVATRDGFVVAFSSVNALFGGAEVAVYGAANAYLDAWADTMRRRGLAHHVIMWPRWGGVGMGADGVDAELLSARGYRSLTVTEGLVALETVMTLSSGRTVVGLLPNNPFIASRVARDPVPMDRLTATCQMPGSDAYCGAREILDDFGTATTIQVSVQDGPVDAGAVDADLLAEVTSMWSAVLNGATVAANAGIFDAGVESLHLPRAQHVLNERLGVRLEIVDFFRYPTSAALASRVAQIRQKPAQAPTQKPPAPSAELSDRTQDRGSTTASARMRRLRSAHREPS